MKISKQISYFCVLTVILIACHRNIEDEFTTVTPDELYSLFSFDTQKDVYENLQLLNSFSTEKQYHVNRKTIVVSNCIPDNIDASQGRFSLTVTGTVNYTPFQEILNFKGFKIETPDERNKNEDEKNESDDKRNESENESGNSEDAQTASHTITKEELKSIFIFDTNQTVTVVLADLEQFNGEKHINGKSIFIDKIIVQQQDTQSGTFTLLVTGNVNGQKDFEETLDFAGFALEKKEEPVNKPTDYNMTKRASIQITHDKNIYESNFDTFYRENNSDEFALQLKDFITISSSNNDGIPYAYTQDDMQNTLLTDIRYDYRDKKLCLKVKYKNDISPELYIPFDCNEYYKTFVTVNLSEARKYYQSGILHYLEEIGDGGYLFSKLLIARTGFLVQYQSASAFSQGINYTAKLLSSNHQELAQFDMVVSGFRDLNNLKNELIITGGEYSDFIQERLKRNANLDELIRNTFKNNISNLHFLINNTRLLYSDSDHSLYNNENKPLYFNDVYIEYQSIVKETDGSFTMLVKLSSVNGRILDEIIPIKRFLLSSDLNN